MESVRLVYSHWSILTFYFTSHEEGLCFMKALILSNEELKKFLEWENNMRMNLPAHFLPGVFFFYQHQIH